MNKQETKNEPKQPSNRGMVEAKSQGLRNFLGSDQVQKALLAVLDDDVRTRRFCRVLLTSVMATPKLLECTQESVFGSIMEAAQLNLDIDGVLGQAYLVPYGKEATLIAGYKGLLALVRRSGECKLESCECVYKADLFRYAMGTSPFIEHVPREVEYTDDRITHVYAIFRHSDGTATINVWTIDRIHAHKKRYSPSWQHRDSAWQTSFPAMARKTVIRDTINSGRVPVSVEVQRLTMREAKIEAEALADSKRIRTVDFDILGSVPNLPEPNAESSKPNGSKGHTTSCDFRKMDLPAEVIDLLERAVTSGDSSKVDEIIADAGQGADEEMLARLVGAGDGAKSEIERKTKKQGTLV